MLDAKFRTPKRPGLELEGLKKFAAAIAVFSHNAHEYYLDSRQQTGASPFKLYGRSCLQFLL